MVWRNFHERSAYDFNDHSGHSGRRPRRHRDDPVRQVRGLSGAIAGGSGDTYLGKNKNKGLDAKLALATKWVGGVFIVLTLVLNLF